jgi:hypothetical protein
MVHLLNNAGKWRDLENTVMESLSIDNRHLKGEPNAMKSKKRSRAGFEGTAGDTTESDMGDEVKKRGRRET